MSNSIAIQPIALYRLAGISSPAFQSLLSATSANGTDTSLLAGTSSIVQLSISGQVLATGAVLQTSLETLQSTTASAASSSALTATQDFVTAFNALQQWIDSAVPFLGALPDSALITQLAQTLNTAATSGSANESLDLSALETIGITLTAASSTDSTGASARLSIDQSTLNAAIQADPPGTATLLAQATRSLLQKVTLFEVQASSSSGLTSESSTAGTTVPTELLQNLSADTVLNTVQLANTDLVAAGLDAATIQSNSGVLDASLAATLAGSISANVLTGSADATSSSSDTTPLASATLSTAAVATPASAVAVTPITASASQPLPQTPGATSISTVSTEQGALDATRILQNMMADSALRDVILNPAYPVFMATSHLTDYTVPMPSTSIGSIPVDIPEAVMPISPIRAISNYRQEANNFVGR